MDIDPMESVDTDEEDDSEADEEHSEATKAAVAEVRRQEHKKGRLNTLVAITVALLATFAGICKVKDDNIVQAMQQAQADKIDNYSWYQARNIREEIGRTAVAQLRAQRAAAPPAARAEFDRQIAVCEALEKDQAEKKKALKDAGDAADKTYNDLNYHDDQFDLSDALLALAVSMLAVTALTQKRWMYGLALVPTFFGVLMGLAGLLGWRIHSDLLAKLLS